MIHDLIAKNDRKNNVLVLIEFRNNYSNLIRCAYKIAEAYQSNFYVVFFEFGGITHEYIDELEFMFKGINLMCTRYSAAASLFRSYKDNKQFYDHFNNLVKELTITNVIMAGEVETRMNEILHGSTLNWLLKEFPDVDFHYISALKKEPWDYDIGIRAYLDKTNDELTFKYDKFRLEGIFFKEKATDFNSGIFKYYENYEEKEYIIFNGFKLRDPLI